MLSFPKIRSGRIRAVKGDIEHHRMARLTNDRLEPCRDPGARPELHLPSPAAQTRIVSVARIRLDSWKFVRPFKGIFCDDISEFESYHPSHAVGSPPGRPGASPRRGDAVSSQTPGSSSGESRRTPGLVWGGPEALPARWLARLESGVELDRESSRHRIKPQSMSMR
jgi:hypothetical protein